VRIFFLKSSLFLLLLGIDRFSKNLIYQKQLTHSCNPYISWSIPLSGIWLWIFIILSLIILFYLAQQISFPWSTLLIFAGAIGNIIDRLKFNCVIDFITFAHFPLLNKISFLSNFPTFNIADILITTGVIWFLFELWLSKNTTSS